PLDSPREVVPIAWRSAACLSGACDGTGIGRSSVSGPRLLNLLNSNHRRGAEAFALDLGRALSNLGLSVETAALTGATNAATHDIDVLGHGWTAPATALARLLNRSRSFDVLLGHGGRTLLSGALVSTLIRRPFAYRVIGEP